MAQIDFLKIQGAGNDFIFIDLRTRNLANLTGLNRPEVVRRLCDRQFGIGADGLVFVEAPEESSEKNSPGGAAHDLRWDFYNTDGSVAEMCGNAARCMGRWADVVMGQPKIKFLTTAGLVRAEVMGDDVSVFLDFVKLDFKDLETATLVNTGVPHMVVEVTGLGLHDKALIKTLRFHPAAGPRGANVTFLVRGTASRPILQTVTFERGVEDFTLACGTGVLAAAAVALRGGNEREADVVAPGGKLKVCLPVGAGAVLTGRADVSFSGVVDPDAIIVTRTQGESK